MNKSCELCKKQFTTADSRKRFCGRSCSATYNNLGNRRHGVEWQPCKKCGGKANPRAGRSGYCSTACRQSHEIELWLAGELDGNRKFEHAAYVQRYLEQRSGLVCEMSNCTEDRKRANGSHILQVDHIDGNWRNNRPENLRMICPSCHALTENWGGYNKNGGRTYNQYESLK